MTPKKKSDHPDEDSFGVLDEAASVDTTAISILGGVAQVSVALPQNDEDDFADEDVVDGEIATDLILDTSAVAAPQENLIGAETGGIVIELPAEEADTVEEEGETEAADEVLTAEPEEVDDAGEAVDEASTEFEDAEDVEEHEEAEEPEDAEGPEEPAAVEDAEELEAAAEETEELESAGGVAENEDAPLDDLFEELPASDDSADIEDPAALSVEEEAEPDVSPPVPVDEAQGEGEHPPLTHPAAPPAAPAEELQETAEHPQEEASTPAAGNGAPEVVLTSKRLGEIGEGNRESADLLTADRLLDPHRVARPEPEGVWSHFLYTVSFGRINLGDSKNVRERKELSARIAAPLAGGARFVPVLSRKGGVGKTTVTTLLGMALADARDDRVIAVDANPDRGTLADRIARPHSKSVRDLVRIHNEVRGYQDISAIVARDETRLDVLASDDDPYISEAFSDEDYRDVADVTERFYSLILTDTGTGIVHSVMGATLDLADQIVIVSGQSVDEARLASETLTWLEKNGHEEKARGAIVVLNQSAPGTPLVRLDELESHFSSRARKVVRIPFDPHISAGGALVFSNLQSTTKQAARELAALLVESLRAV